MMKIKPLGKHLEHLSEQELIDGNYTVMWMIDPKTICPNCKKSREGKGSLIAPGGQAFCSDGCYEMWAIKNAGMLQMQLDILGELIHDLRNLDPLIENMPGWEKAVESGALDGWV